MLTIENTEVMGWEHAIRGSRNPMNSWAKSDSGLITTNEDDVQFGYPPITEFNIGENDLELMKKLSRSGSDHGKFMRMITVYVDITAPLYWWKEFDTYKVGTVANSCSTMHKITSKEITMDDFSIDNFILEDTPMELELCDYFYNVVSDCETLRKLFIETNDKKYWKGLIQLLPESYNQKRTVMLNYEVLKNMYHARRNHKLDEWHQFCDWIESLPYAKDLICIKNN